MTLRDLEDWRELLTHFPEEESLLQGAAGEDAMNVADVRRIVQYAYDLGNALHEVVGGWNDIDPRIRYVETQVDKDEMRHIYKLLGLSEPKFK